MSEPAGEFANWLAGVDLAELSRYAERATDADVTAALTAASAASSGHGANHGGGPGRDLQALAALLSPAATPRLEELAAAAREVTIQRFGRTVRLFAPLYVSNACLSSCTYCGFAKGLDVPRRTLTFDQVETEARMLADQGFRHLLLVSGEHRVEVSADYLVECVRRLRPFVPSLSIETQTWSDDTYDRLVDAGLEGVVLYQETYDPVRYAQVHPAGWKRDFNRRLSTMERAGRAGVRRLGVGALLGLAEDWRADVLAVAAHAAFLIRRYWRSEVTVSLPRIKPSASGYQPLVEITDPLFVQATTALRLFEPSAGIVLSTRESQAMRDGLVRIAVTHVSAGVSTEPGGYSDPGQAQEQFTISDERSLPQMAEALTSAGYEPVYRDAFVPLRAGTVPAQPAGVFTAQPASGATALPEGVPRAESIPR